MITEEFKTTYFKFVKEFENEKLKIYDDGFGNPTIGVGFALINKVGGKWKAYKKEDLQKLGINLTTKQHKIIENYAEAKSEGKDTSYLRDQLKNLDFTITPEISQKLLMYSVEDKYNIIKTSVGEEHWDKLNLAQQIGVMDYAFHKGNIKKLKKYLIAGNYNDTAKEMRKEKRIFKARAELRADLVKYGKMEFKRVYIVKNGDYLGKIAQLHGLKLDELKKLNPELSDELKLSVGQKINVPATLKTIPLIYVDDEGNKFQFEIVHKKFKLSEDNIAGETKEISLSIGSFFVRLKANNQVANIGQCSKDSIFLHKTSLNTENSIINFFNTTGGVTEGSIHAKTLNLTKEEHDKILQYITSGIKYGDIKVLQSQTSANEMSNHYVVKADNSASLVQNLYHAAGLPLYFTAAYSKPELVSLESADAKNALEAYSSRDDIIKKLNSVYGDSSEEIAKMLNLDPEQVVRISYLKGCVPSCKAVEGAKFSVKIDQAMLDSITSIIDVSDDKEPLETKSDNKSIQAHNVSNTNNMCQKLNELFLSFKIPPEICQDGSSSKPSTSSAKDNDKFRNQDTDYVNFQKLRDSIKEELLKYKSKLDKLLLRVDKQEQSTSSGSHYTEQELMSIFQEKVKVLQAEFKSTNDHYQKDPHQYKYELGDTLPGSAEFNREYLKVNTWLYEELSKIKGMATNIPGKDNTSQKIKEEIIRDWNKAIDSLKRKAEFNDKINESINKIDQTVAIITHDMELFLHGEESITA